MPTELVMYTEKDLQKARTRGQLVGIAQGAAGIVALGFALAFLKWVPVILIAGGVGYAGWKMLTRKKAE